MGDLDRVEERGGGEKCLHVCVSISGVVLSVKRQADFTRLSHQANSKDHQVQPVFEEPPEIFSSSWHSTAKP